jgi:hypothetical protein
MQAVWWLVWPKLFGPGARAIEGWTPSGHTRLLSASRLTVAPSHCMHSQQSGQQSATLLRSSSGSAGAGRQAVLTAVICFGLCASEEWGFAYMLRSGSKLVSACNLTLPLVAACSCACVLRAFPAGIARLRDRIRRLRATCISKEDQQIMQSMIIRPKHISVRNPQAPGPRSRSALCSRPAKALRRSDTTHFRWSPAVECLVHPMQASSRWDPTRGDLCSRLHARATDFHFTNRGTGILF